MTHACLVDPRIDDCCHTECLIAAGLRPEISRFNNWFRYQGQYNYLRSKWNTPKDSAERTACAAVYWVLKKEFQLESKMDIMGLVWVGILPCEVK